MSATNHLIQLYNKNLLYFQRFYPALYKKLTNFNQKTDNSLTIEDNLYFDVVDKRRNSFIYGSNSEILSQLYVKNILKEKKNQNSKKVLFNGSLLGIHIEKYFQQIDSEVCMIIEPDLEIFHFSTFVVDFEQLTINRITIFSISDDDEEFEKKLLKFYYTLPYYNDNITVASINNQSQNSAIQINRVFEENTAVKNISIQSPNKNIKKYIDIPTIYQKALSLTLNNKQEKAKELYFNIIQHERYIKLSQNYRQNMEYIYKAYLELANILISQLETKQAYYFYAKIIYSNLVPYKTYEAALSNYGGVHGKLNINYKYITKKLESFYEKHPNSHFIKNILILIYSRTNEYEKANLLLEEHDIPVFPTFINSEQEIDKIRQSFEQKLDKLSKKDKKLTEDEVKSTNFFYLANHNRNNKTILTKLSNLYTQRTPSLSFKANHCKNYKYSGKKMKIGFISAFFQINHPIGKFINNTIKQIDRDKNFEVTVYALTKSDLENSINNYITLKGTLKQQRKIIAKNRLDILIYPEIGMDTMTYFLAHSRLAPIQCVLPGHPSTTGIKNIDYFISHKDLETEDGQKNYSETLIKLDNILSYYDKPKIAKESYLKENLELCKDSTNYLIPTSLQKLHPSFDDILLEITERDSYAKFIFFESNTKNNMDYFVKKRLLKKIDTKNIIFRRWAKPDEFYNLLYHANAVLEPTIFGFGTTMMEALSIGTPIVTLPGSTLASRGGGAFYKKIGVLDLIATDEEDYVKLAIKLANNPIFKDSIREKILKNSHIIYKNSDVVSELTNFFRKKLLEI